MDEQTLIEALQDHRRNLESLTAETFALQAIILQMATAMANRPDLRPVVLQAFDDAAGLVARMSLREDKPSTFVSQSLGVIDRFREAFTGDRKA